MRGDGRMGLRAEMKLRGCCRIFKTRVELHLAELQGAE